MILGSAHVDSPSPHEGLLHCREAQLTLQPMKIKVGAPQFTALLADLCRAAGHLEDATKTLQTAAAFAAGTRQHFWDAEIERLEAEVMLRRSSAMNGEARRHLEHALDVARRQGAKWFELRIAVSLARLLEKDDDYEEARTVLAQVCQGFEADFDSPDVAEARSLLEDMEEVKVARKS